MALPLTGPISFGDLNDEIGNNTNDTLDLIQAGLDFGFSPGAPTLGGTWEDAVPGLSLGEFRGTTANNGLATYAQLQNLQPSSYTLFLQSTSTPSPNGPTIPTSAYTIIQPGTLVPVAKPQSGTVVSVLTAGPHTLPIEVVSDGTYVVSNLSPSDRFPVSFNPTEGGTAEQLTVNNHIITIPSLPATTETLSDLPTLAQNLSSPSSMYRGSIVLYDRYATLDDPEAWGMDNVGIFTMYNDRPLSQNPTPVPYNPGTYQVSTIDWKFNTYFNVGTQGPENPLPNTNTSIVTNQTVGSTNLQSLSDNFTRTGVNVTVNYNNSPSPRQTYIYAYVPFSGPDPGGTATWGLEMNRDGNEFNSFYDGYYYSIPVVQDGSPVTSNTLTLTPSSIPFDTNGGTSVPISLNITPNTNPFSYTVSPFITVNSLPTPNSGDKTFTVSVGTSGTPRNGEVLFTHPGGITPLQVSQTGVDVGVTGYDAALGPAGNTYNRPVSYSATSLATPVFTNTPSSAPWTATVLPSPTPFISLPSPTSRSGPAPTFQANFPVNNNQSEKNQTIEFDFNISGTPYITRFNVTQGAAPLPIVNIPAGSNRTFPSGGGTTIYEVFANEPFTVNFSTPTPKLTINPTNTNFPAPSPGGALTPYTFTITGAPNPIYQSYTSTFTVDSPIFPNPNQSPSGPISYTQTLSANPGDVVITYNPSAPPVGNAFGGAWTYTPTGLSLPSSGGSVTTGVKATRLSDGSIINAPFTVNFRAPNPAVPTGYSGIPVSISTPRTSPGTVTMNIPSNPSSTFQKSFYVYLTSPHPIGASQVDGLQAKFVPEFSISTSQIVIDEAGSVVTRGLSSNVQWTVPLNPAPWLTVSPTSGGGPTTISFDATAVGSSDRSTNVTFTSPQGGPKTIPVVQYAPEPDSWVLTPSGPTLIPYLGGYTPAKSLNVTPNAVSWNVSSSNPLFPINVGPSGTGDAPFVRVYAGPNGTPISRGTSITFSSPNPDLSPIVYSVSQPAAPVPNTLNISPTDVTLPYGIGFGETITATGTGTATYFTQISGPGLPWVDVSIGTYTPTPVNTPFVINSTEPWSPTTPRTATVTVYHPVNNYIIDVTQEGAPEPTPGPTPTPQPCYAIEVRRSNSSAASACSAFRLVTHYFNASSLNAADRYYGTSSNCSTLQINTYWVADFDGGNSWAKFENGIRTDFGICGF